MSDTRYVLNVEGMSCGGCVRSVRKMISKSMALEEDQVQVDLASKRASFEVDRAVVLTGLLDKLEKRGFPSSVVAPSP